MRIGKCEVCTKAEHKYRCPKCNVKYCSLGCFKNHKNSCADQVDTGDCVVNAVVPQETNCPQPHNAIGPESRLSDQQIQNGEVQESGQGNGTCNRTKDGVTGEVQESGQGNGTCDRTKDGVTGGANPTTVARNMEESDRVPDDSLHRLGESADLRHLLTNPHLRQMLTSLDTSPSPDQHITDAMHEPIFTEFADTCLKIVNPEQNISTLRLQST